VGQVGQVGQEVGQEMGQEVGQEFAIEPERAEFRPILMWVVQD
jgi:hypothetical protein